MNDAIHHGCEYALSHETPFNFQAGVGFSGLLPSEFGESGQGGALTFPTRLSQPNPVHAHAAHITFQFCF